MRVSAPVSTAWVVSGVIGASLFLPTDRALASDAEGPQRGGDPIELEFAAFGAPRPFTEVIGLWADEVEDRTAGAVQITWHHQGTQNGMLDSVATGQYDGGLWVGSDIVQRTPLLSVTTQPGLTDDGEALAEAGLHVSRLQVVQDELAALGVIYAAPAVVPTLGYMGRCEATSVEMLQGLPLRTFGGATALMGLLGADARSLPQTAIWPGMNLDPADPDFLCGGLSSWPATLSVTVFQPWLAADAPFELYATHDLGIGANAYQIIVNSSVWDGLPGWARSAMRDAAEGIPSAHYDVVTANDAAIIASFEAEGVHVTAFSDVDEVREAADIVLADWVCGVPDPEDGALVLQSTKAFIAEIEAIRSVDALLDAGTLQALDAAWLLRKLEAAVEAGERSEVADAIQRLEGFLERVDALVEDGELTEAEAQPASDAATRAIEALASIPAIASSCD